jgi:hypothetical protein
MGLDEEGLHFGISLVSSVALFHPQSAAVSQGQPKSSTPDGHIMER